MGSDDVDDREGEAGPVSLGSLLAASEPLLTPGEEGVVCVAVATMWSAPDAVRQVDMPALGMPSRPRAWIDAMSPADPAGLKGSGIKQLLLGERVVVLDGRGHWALVVAPSQPSTLDPRGYPGWIPLDQLSAVSGLFVAGV